MMRPAAFAIPGDIATLTGGYIYERRLLEGLRSLGHDVTHVELGDSFPAPTQTDMDKAIEQLTDLPSDRALILDGLVYGSIATEGLAQVKSPIVAMIHHPLALETGLDAGTKQHLYQTERDNLALASRVLVPSPHTAHILMRDYAVPESRITIAQPGTLQPARPRNPSSPPLILSVGIQHPRKGHDVLLRALSGLQDLDWRVVIVGKAHDADHARALVSLRDELALGERVTLAGRLPQDKLDMLYAEASIFALATRYEGYGIVFDEALAHGLPIVSCQTGAVPQTVPETAGILVSPDDPTALADALASVLNDAALRNSMGAAAREIGASLPTWVDTARTASGVLNTL